jgi:hypothetical protein
VKLKLMLKLRINLKKLKTKLSKNLKPQKPVQNQKSLPAALTRNANLTASEQFQLVES